MLLKRIIEVLIFSALYALLAWLMYFPIIIISGLTGYNPVGPDRMGMIGTVYLVLTLLAHLGPLTYVQRRKNLVLTTIVLLISAYVAFLPAAAFFLQDLVIPRAAFFFFPDF